MLAIPHRSLGDFRRGRLSSTLCLFSFQLGTVSRLYYDGDFHMRLRPDESSPCQIYIHKLKPCREFMATFLNRPLVDQLASLADKLDGFVLDYEEVALLMAVFTTSPCTWFVFGNLFDLRSSYLHLKHSMSYVQ